MTTTEIAKNKHGYYSVVNIPAEKELAEYYAEKYYQEANGSYEIEYDEAEVAYFRNKIAERVYVIEKNLREGAVKTFLDIGCGEGWALQFFKEKGWEVLGLDYSSFGCEKFNPSCLENLIAGNIYDNLNGLIKEGRKFTTLWIDNVLEHVTDPEFLIAELKKVMEPGGILVIEVPNDFSFLQNYLVSNKIVDRQYWIVTPDHLSYFNSDGLRSLLTDHGFTTVELISDYPIDINLLNPNTNFVQDKSKGKSCHRERIAFENLIHTGPIEKVIAYYRASAELGLGRLITGFFKLG